MNYFELNLYFVIPALLLLVVFFKLVDWKALAVATFALLLVTAIFDNFIVGSGIVAYDESLTSGIKIGFAPIEDFAYTLFGAILIPISWWLLGKKNKLKDKSK
jgi:lycopene cyclase domain-containing protein